MSVRVHELFWLVLSTNILYDIYCTVSEDIAVFPQTYHYISNIEKAILGDYPMNYMTPQEAAKKWEVSIRRVQYLCTNNKIPDIQFVNHRWLIPVNATYPQKVKGKNEKLNIIQDDYHFPLFLFSDYYPTKRELNDIEIQLLNAQILIAQGQHMECLRLCRQLEAPDLSLSMKFSLYCTIVYASLPLGLYGNIINYMQFMEKICNKSPEHAADYELLIAIFRFQYTYNTSALLKINVDNLSPQALIAYKCFSMQASVYTDNVESEMALRICAAMCKNFEITGNLPAAFIAHSFLALFYGRAGKSSEQNLHIEIACRIGCEQKYYGLLTKYSSLNPDAYKKYIFMYDHDFAVKLDELRKDNQTKWRIVYNLARGKKVFPNCSAEDADFLMVLTYNMSNKEIAKTKNVPVKDISFTIKRLCKQYDLKSKSELVSYSKNIFSAME